MLGYMLSTLGEEGGRDWAIRTAGTLVSEGRAISARTRAALDAIPELRRHNFNEHRSHRFDERDGAWSDVVLAMEASHVAFVRHRFPEAAAKTVSFGQLLRDAMPHATLLENVASQSLREPDPDCDIEDPAGGELEIYEACARGLWQSAQTFATMFASSI